jgi:lipopolysaccharide transport system permease protein
MPSPADTSLAAKPVSVIKPAARWSPVNLRELWSSRELVGFLAWRDISVRYKQTALGASWAVIQPFMTMVVFSLIFGHLAKISTGSDIPYPVFSFAGLLAWQFFSYSINEAGRSLVVNQNLVTKVYFPRLTIPLAAVLGGLVDLAIAGVVFGGLMLVYGQAPGWPIVTLPFFVVLAVIAALGIGLWLSALAVTYRDVQYAIPFLVQIGLFATPIAYPASLVPEGSRFLLGLNPMAGVVEGFRWALIGGYPRPGPWLAVSVAVALAVFVSGLYYFRRMEDHFADRI